MLTSLVAEKASGQTRHSASPKCGALGGGRAAHGARSASGAPPDGQIVAPWALIARQPTVSSKRLKTDPGSSLQFAWSFRLVEPFQQPPGPGHEGFIGEPVGFHALLAQSLIGPPPHALRLRRKRHVSAEITPKALPNLDGAPRRPVEAAFPLAGVGQLMAMAAEKVADPRNASAHLGW